MRIFTSSLAASCPSAWKQVFRGCFIRAKPSGKERTARCRLWRSGAAKSGGKIISEEFSFFCHRVSFTSLVDYCVVFFNRATAMRCFDVVLFVHDDLHGQLASATRAKGGAAREGRRAQCAPRGEDAGGAGRPVRCLLGPRAHRPASWAGPVYKEMLLGANPPLIQTCFPGELLLPTRAKDASVSAWPWRALARWANLRLCVPRTSPPIQIAECWRPSVTETKTTLPGGRLAPPRPAPPRGRRGFGIRRRPRAQDNEGAMFYACCLLRSALVRRTGSFGQSGELLHPYWWGGPRAFNNIINETN